MSDILSTAVDLAAEAYEAFMREVVENGVLGDRGGSLDPKKRKAVDQGKSVDTRVVRLMSISGKGGWSPDPERQARYAHSTNVTLLDHLLSVVRGAVAFAALDVLRGNPDLDRHALRARLRVLAAIAFVHDLDKDLGLERDTALPLDRIAERWTRYGLDRFVGDDQALAADQVRYLIEQEETTQAHRSAPAVYPSRQIEQLMKYVALADKLDGLWLSEGVDAVLQRLQTDRTLSSDLLREWTVIDLLDPHHPFLVDELQRWLSAQCRPIPPLIEVHQDGRLVMLVPAQRADEIKSRAIERLCAFLSKKLFGMRVNISNRGTPQILDAAPDHAALTDYFAGDDLPERERGRLFLVKAGLADEEHTRHLDDLLGDIGLGPSWPKASGQTLSPYSSPATLSEEAQQRLRLAGHLVLLLNHKQVKTLPVYDDREQSLLRVIGTERPGWISAVGDAGSRRTVTALWAMRRAADDQDLQQRIWGTDGLLQRWLEGSADGPGLRAAIKGEGDAKIEAVAEHFADRLLARPVHARPKAAHRCIFTGLPVPKEATFASADKLYEIKKSAFSGRDGRLESIDSALGETHISPVSYVEHRCRNFVHAFVTGKPDGTPTLLSSPSTTGLFAALTAINDGDYRTLSVYDLAREQKSKGTVYTRMDVYRHRYRVARFERMPERTEDQVDLLRLLLRAALRVGRPIHLFRGLPTPERAFFAFDAMPRRLADLIGGSRLRLEQIPDALERLSTVQLILTTNGLGFEVFDRYTRPATRLGALCLTWAQLHDEAADGKPERGRRFRHELEQLISENDMSETEAPLVALGRAATRIQRRPHGAASANDELRTFNLSMDAAIDAWKLGQKDRESIAMAVAGELETNLVRKQKQAARSKRDDVSLMDECVRFARQFVDEVWLGVLGGRPPAQANRRILASIYRMSFLTARRPETDADDTPAKEQ